MVFALPTGCNENNVTETVLVLTGLKPGPRKVVFSAFKRKVKNDVKVVQLAGCVAEVSAYHHGEVRPHVFSTLFLELTFFFLNMLGALYIYDVIDFKNKKLLY